MVSLLCYLEYLFDRLATAAFAVAGAAALATTVTAFATGATIAALREKYDLHMTVARYAPAVIAAPTPLANRIRLAGKIL